MKQSLFTLLIKEMELKKITHNKTKKLVMDRDFAKSILILKIRNV